MIYDLYANLFYNLAMFISINVLYINSKNSNVDKLKNYKSLFSLKIYLQNIE